jgi:hypothetical protein
VCSSDLGKEKENTSEMLKSGDLMAIHTIRNETPLEVVLHAPPYTMRGIIDTEIWQQLLNTMNGVDRFLPLVNVNVQSTLDDSGSEYDFVAVNRNKIVFVGESFPCINNPSPIYQASC